MGWKKYDKQFKLRCRVDPSILWSKIDHELWLMFMQSPQQFMPFKLLWFHTGTISVLTSITKVIVIDQIVKIRTLASSVVGLIPSKRIPS